MKKTLMSIAVIFCAAMAMTLTSCKKDAEDLIIGDWDYVNAEIKYTVSGLTGEYAMYNQDTTAIEEPEAGESQTITFRKDGTFTMSSTYPEEGTQTENGTYTIENENITLTVNNEPQVFQLAVDKKTLSLTLTETQQLPLEENQVATMTYSVKMNFNKKK